MNRKSIDSSIISNVFWNCKGCVGTNCDYPSRQLTLITEFMLLNVHLEKRLYKHNIVLIVLKI